MFRKLKKFQITEIPFQFDSVHDVLYKNCNSNVFEKTIRVLVLVVHVLILCNLAVTTGALAFCFQTLTGMPVL